MAPAIRSALSSCFKHQSLTANTAWPAESGEKLTIAVRPNFPTLKSYHGLNSRISSATLSETVCCCRLPAKLIGQAHTSIIDFN